MSNNKIILNGCIDQFKKQNLIELQGGVVFELFSLTQITKNLNVTYEDISNSITDGGLDGGLDSILIIVDDEVINSIEDLSDIKLTNKSVVQILITQCKEEKSFKELTLDKLHSSCSIIFDLEKNEYYLEQRFNVSLIEKISILRKAWMDTSINGGKLEIDVNYCCVANNIEVNDAFTSKGTQLESLIKEKCNINDVRFSCFSSEELLKLYQTKKQTRLSLTFKDLPLSTSFSEKGIGYVGTVNLGSYKQFLTDDDDSIRDYLFESNIRHYQGTVDVNKKIATTIADDFSSDFWWLNNGITMIAENPNQAGKVLSVDNVQIVNGLQTSYSIFKSHNGATNDERSVLVKVIINTEKDTVNNIIESTNSQNAVSPTVLRATDDTQKNIELYFENEGYFYDRRKNYYKNLGKPASKIFSIQFAAQAIETIAFNSPHTARSKPTSLIKDDKTYNKIFDNNRNFKSYLNCCLILKRTNDFWGCIEEIEKKEFTTNFKLHLARVATSVLTNKTESKFEDLTSIDLSNYTKAKFVTALDLLTDLIGTYKENNPSVNYINMAKTRPFSEYISDNLKHIFC